MSKDLISRRRFCYSALAGLTTVSAGRLPLVGTQSLSARAGAPLHSIELAAFEHKRVLAAANRYLGERPITLTGSSSPRSAGGKHDYFSEGDYWWPDPKDPTGPYIQRDGLSNPDNFTAHRHALIRLGVQVPALTAAWVLTRDGRYAHHAAEHLRAWFIRPETMMNPNLQYAQAIHGRTTGRGTGIIDTIHLVEVVRSIPHLAESKALNHSEQESLKHWFSDYVEWLATSKNGQEERDAKNNHGTWWVAQVAEFASFVGETRQMDFCRDRYKTVLIPHQVAADGTLPEELRRTKPYNYCLFNLAGLTTICQVLSTKEDNLFAFALPDGRGLAKAIAFMFPFLKSKTSWPYAHDVEYYQYWPIRQPTWLFAGVGLEQPEYVSFWKTLPDEPEVEEIVRNNPIRQPILWLDRKTSV